ncbi:hypothetical protein DHEL01_v200386 [Diaporthe helianthi]|uniref:Uncharacterized protein n=1 Tax=Diaporthe helianthi TaxID=158607 RepID=A0A2P5IFF4_DIAHE|nr:hypothetical protein DHEL01_v200386 [Diaporthe helianthi]
MSHYPYGYGYKGQQPPQQQYPFPPYGAYPAPGYGTQPPPQQQLPPATAEYYASTQSAYDYNANNIPGLGTPLTAPQFPVPYAGQWNQPGYATSTTSAAYPAYNASPFVPTPPALPSQANSRANVPVPQESQPKSQFRQDSSHVQNKTHPKEDQLKEQAKQPLKETESQDEGEISDGEFDDLYEDVYDQPVAQPKTKTVSPVSSEEHTAGSTDQAANFYDTEMDEASAPSGHPGAATNKARGNELSKEQDLSRTERDRSGSYSPHLSPREIELEDQKQQAKENDSQGVIKSIGNASTPVLSSPSNSPGVQDQVHVFSIHGKEAAVATGQTDSAVDSTQSSRSLPEAQNEAKKAILRLLPHGVKYQTYLDEGFDEKVVKDLFTQLHLTPVVAESSASAKPADAQEHKTKDQDTKPAPTSPADVMAKKQEERKDKIARLLAEKKAKAAAEATIQSKAPSVPASIGASTTSATPATKTTTQAQKNLLLQQKMEALRKAQEARTQQGGQQTKQTPTLSEAPKNDSSTQKLSSASTIAKQTPAVSNTVQVSASSATLPTPQDPPRQPASRPTPGFQSPVLPGLSNKPINQRKRPVAADFVDYQAKAVKRPFVPSLQASSLVISVSDDEDEDDEDVEMEVDSATEDSPVPTQQTFNLPRRGPSVRDYPPLTNSGPTRHIGSPAPGTPGGKTATVDLKAMEKAIADYKRKIQEAEARAKVKTSTGSSTPRSPSAGGRTPTEQATRPVAQPVVSTGDVDDKNGPSNQLLREAEAAKIAKPQSFSPPNMHSKAERRVRKASAHPPGLSIKLRDKIAELKRMEEEKRRLQAEIDAELAQQQRMEREDMGDDTEELGSDSAGGHISETVPANKAAVSGDPGQDEAEQILTDEPLHLMPMELESSPGKSDSGAESSTSASFPPVAAAVGETGSNELHTHESDLAGDASQPPPHQPAEILAAIAMSSPSEERVVAVADSNTSDDYEPPDEAGDDLGLKYSPPFTPAPAENVQNTDTSGGGSQETASPPAMPSQISTATKPNDDPTIEARADFFAHPSARTANVSREDAHESVPPSETSFTNYESPLRYYHAFRFHPKYRSSVPMNWRGKTAPEETLASFSIFRTWLLRVSRVSLVAGPLTVVIRPPAYPSKADRDFLTLPDDKIILELGSSDDLAGDQKKTFNNGLRELVASFQKSKIRDFRTIAQGIVEFRRRFLGDSSRVLHLDGVSI